MSQKSQHGRRRIETLRGTSAARRWWEAAPKPGPAGRRMTAVAIAGFLLVGVGASNAALNNGGTPGPQAAPADAAVAAPSSATLSFTRTAVKSSAAPTATPNVRAAASDVQVLGANGGAVNDPAGAKAYAAASLASFGWGPEQMACLLPLWTQESDWTTTAENPSTLAYGIVQSLPAEKMDSVGNDWKNNYQTQIKWGLNYIKDRYGSPCGAWDHETAMNWY
ncbi:hypothetical protein [Arthrobacter sp. H14-L1]|uniref:aggregation-promoting factor C-terminal-like domain-containing protein n=1 Tax=Arthrobacter sp. H14-L1 TaxID=2996697 RepID=UPI00226F18DC|nr:hypothetical protein [Arthrobacter sp. H14-L1]MCY0905604.1 hypothetical protein [Arthrobacter sp. H14-L1]